MKTYAELEAECILLRSQVAALQLELAQTRRNPSSDAIDRIKAIVDVACNDAYDHLRPVSREAINWGDLGWADVGTKNDGFYVVIEEAAPDAWQLCQFVADRLAAAGYDNVYVSTQW